MKWLLIVVLLTATPVMAAPTEEMCEAVTIAKESRGESLEGSRAVLSVLRNRMRMNNMTACEVVMQKGQWSWYRRNMAWRISKKQWTRYDKVRIMPDKVGPNVFYFRSGKRKIKWYGRYCCRVGRHIFFYK